MNNFENIKETHIEFDKFIKFIDEKLDSSIKKLAFTDDLYEELKAKNEITEIKNIKRYIADYIEWETQNESDKIDEE